MLFDVGASLESEENAMQTTKRGKRGVKVKYLICKDFSNHGLPEHIYSLYCLTQHSQTTKTTMVRPLMG